MTRFFYILVLILAASESYASPTQSTGLVERLSTIRNQVIVMEKGLISSLKNQNQAKENLKRIQALVKLQKEERNLGQKRMAELEKTIGELEHRRGHLKEKILVQKKQIRKALMEIQSSASEVPRSVKLTEREIIEAPRRKVLALLADRGIKEIETLKADLTDADQIEGHIQEERHHLAYLFQDLKEQESILELNRQLQLDLLKRNSADRIAQLENYRRLKNAESQVERLIHDFNARMELEKAVETERLVSNSMNQGDFSRLKGQLPMPVSGKIVTQFGRSFDSKSNLYIFKKGIDIAAGKKQPVRAVFSGKIAYSGELPNYGRVTIINHGDHFYTLCAHLGELHKKVGDLVAAGDNVGISDDAGSPIYFEIRARNIAVNPLQWISN